MKMLERFWMGCGHCHGADACPLLQSAEQSYAERPWFRGRVLVGVATAVFLIPLLTGMAGAYVIERWWAPGNSAAAGWWQMLGLLGGGAVGLGVARLMVRWTGLSACAREHGDAA